MALTLERLKELEKERGSVQTKGSPREKTVLPWQIHVSNENNSDTNSLETIPNHKNGQAPIQRGTNGEQTLQNDDSKGNNLSPKGEQTPSQRGTKGEQAQQNNNLKGNKRPFKEEQAASQRGTKGEQARQNGNSKGNKQLSKGEQRAVVPLSSASCSPLKDELFPFDRPLKGEQTTVVPLSPVSCSPLKDKLSPFDQPSNEDNVTSRKILLPTSGQQLNILRFLYEEQVKTGLDSTPRIKRDQIAKLLKISKDTAKVQIRRLCSKGYLIKLDSKHGRGSSGTVFKVPKEVIDVLQNIPLLTRNVYEEPIKGEQQRGTLSTVSSSNLNTTTNNEKIIIRQIERTVSKLNLDTNFKIAANDLLPIWKSEVFDNNFEEFLLSLEHVSFYLMSEQAVGIKFPKAWFIKQIKNGYYPAPADFVSFEEKIAQAKLEDSKKRLEKLKNIQKQRIQAEFEIWLLQLDDSQIAEYLAGTPLPNNRDAQVSRAHLFKKFQEK